ncbi:protein doublesex-like isoform X3 [Dinothrombium tinctorium]|uniref:Protein doublesex-like isoform X3 n=1 Tax=Dinothrombium tinctorium TaxID=1965070 RepID=A0A3S3P2A2_9ACAR|nr:protein doublesex-like isoform X3 [Dinothrombium tinctorium]
METVDTKNEKKACNSPTSTTSSPPTSPANANQSNSLNQSNGHKSWCKYKDCECEPCTLTSARQKIMAEQVKLRRAQDEDRANNRVPPEPVPKTLKRKRAEEKENELELWNKIENTENKALGLYVLSAFLRVCGTVENAIEVLKKEERMDRLKSDDLSFIEQPLQRLHYVFPYSNWHTNLNDMNMPSLDIFRNIEIYRSLYGNYFHSLGSLSQGRGL